jgi:hypothetical protein
MGLHRFGEKGQQMSLLLGTGGRYGQHALDKTAAVRTPRAKTALAPQHSWPQCPFGRIIRRFDSLDMQKRLQRRPYRQQFAAERLHAVPADLLPRLQCVMGGFA